MGLVLDSSALIAILKDEPERYYFNRIIQKSSPLFMSSINYVETSIVCERNIEDGKDKIDFLLDAINTEIHPVTAVHAGIARNAYRAYGRGSGHQAKLNMGDCFAYALAKEKDLPLLFKGNDFNNTDIKRAA